MTEMTVGTHTLRRMEKSDVPQVAALERRIFSDPWSESAFRNEARGDERSWLRLGVDEDNHVVAYLVAWFVADEVHLANLAVAPEARRRGWGNLLLEELLVEGEKREARLVILEVRRSNTAAQGLYQRHGFYTVSVRRGYYQDDREDALVMVKPLTVAGRIPPEKGVNR